MKARHKILLLPVILVVWLSTNAFDWRYQPDAQLGVDLVMIDPGHGGKDPGAIGLSKVYEKTVALNISKEIARLINVNKNGMNAALTREDDRFVGLYDRAKLANQKNAALFLSIHANSAPNGSANGTETFAMGMHKNDANLEVMKRENSVILMEENHKEKYDGFDPTCEEATIIFKLQQHAYVKQSLSLARLVEDQFKMDVKRVSRGVKQAGFLVLWKTKMPSVLVEAGFLSNRADETFLKSAEGQRAMAAAIYRAVYKYKHGSGI